MELPTRILQYFPNLISCGFRVTSPACPKYNCIAWAAYEDKRWWWPDQEGIGYWPEEASVPREVTIEAFVAAYATQGYMVCESGDLEDGLEKIAIYAKQRVPTHAARQLANGKWTSKLGQEHDIEHNSLAGLSGRHYGEVVQFLKRPRKEAV